jgi:hypothetical protein
MADSHDTAAKNIREYAAQVQERQDNQMDVDASTDDIETRLDTTRKELEDRVEQHRTALEEVCWQRNPLSTPY